MNNWHLSASELGKLSNIKIRVSPFMIFVGENNTGKSYLMELLWGILSKAGELSNHMLEQPEIVDITKKTLEFDKEYKIDTENLNSIIRAFNQGLENSQKTFVSSIFNYPVNINGLSINFENLDDFQFTYLIKEASIHFKSDEEQDRNEDKTIYIDLLDRGKCILSAYLNGSLNQSNCEIILEHLCKRIMIYMLRKDFYEDQFIFKLNNSLHDPIYFPASRTGFMHTYRAIIGNQRNNTDAITEIGIQLGNRNDYTQIAGTNLTVPTIVFLENLQKLTFSESSKEFYRNEIDFFEISILKGRVNKNKFDSYDFTDNNSESSVPLHVTSSLIAELSPMYLFLNSNVKSKLWIIEEIESHLNPKIQLDVVRLLIKLFNKGKSIWITTHSDSLVQRINNIITLSYKKNGDLLNKFNYDKSDIFNNLHLVRAYEFYCNNIHTEVKELEQTEFGFDFEIFNDTIDSIIRETYLVQELDEVDD